MFNVTKVCQQCADSINQGNYVFIDNENNYTVHEISDTSLKRRCGDGNDVIYIDTSGKSLVIKDDDEIQINEEHVFNTNKNFKDALLSSLLTDGIP